MAKQYRHPETGEFISYEEWRELQFEEFDDWEDFEDWDSFGEEEYEG